MDEITGIVEMAKVLMWNIQLRQTALQQGLDVPEGVLTVAPAFHEEAIPLEVGSLLPTSAGPRAFIELIDQEGPDLTRFAVGLFLADPFLNLGRECVRIRNTGARWIASLPSVEQHDQEFTQQLSDVGLDSSRERDCLSRFREGGFNIAAVVSDGDSATQAAKLRPEILIVLPRVSDFAAGFPSARQRGAAAQTVKDAAVEAGWSGLLLGLGQSEEMAYESQWPSSLDGLLLRPEHCMLNALSSFSQRGQTV